VFDKDNVGVTSTLLDDCVEVVVNKEVVEGIVDDDDDVVVVVVIVVVIVVVGAGVGDDVAHLLTSSQSHGAAQLPKQF